MFAVAASLPAQNRAGSVNPGGIIRRAVPSVVLPAGTSAMPGVQRFAPNVVYPAGAPSIGIPGLEAVPPPLGITSGNRYRGDFRNRRGLVYPIFVGGGYYAPAYVDPMLVQSPAPQPQVQPVIVIFQQQPQQQQVTSYQEETPYQGPRSRIFELPTLNRAPATPEPENEQYLLAFKDGSVYSSVAYWVDRDTLHYFTTGNVHNQASLSLVNRELTRKLNENAGREVKLPPVE